MTKKTPAKKEHDRSHNTDFNRLFRNLLKDEELMFQAFDLFPLPGAVYAADGTCIFSNRAVLEFYNAVEDLVTGVYNIRKAPVYHSQKDLWECVQKAYKGEACVAYDAIMPIEKFVDQKVVEEKPFEKGFADGYFFPLIKDGKVAYMINFLIPKRVYEGRPLIAKAQEYIDKHWLHEYNPQAVAESVNMSVTQLYKLFKQQFGMTPGEYHKRVKLEQIKIKLEDKNLSVKEAFFACGEDYKGAFARYFRRETGLSPKQYREQNRQV
jgi:AraC-like DNA-binding protein